MRNRLLLAAFALLVVGAIGCDDSPEEGRATIAVTSINDGSPLESDVAEGGVVFEDLVGVTFFSRPYNQFITAPRGEAIVESYRIEWVRTDGGDETLPARTESCNIYVPLETEASGVIRLVSWNEKDSALLSALVGTANTVTMRATITFTAREVGTEHEIKFQTTASVHFADTL